MLALLDEVGSPATMGIAGPRFFGFVIGGVAARRAGRELARVGLGSERGLPLAVPRASRCSSRSRSSGCARSSACPTGTAGAFVTGATMANFSALAAARHAVLAGQDWDVEADGLFGAPPITVVIGEEAHPTLIKALGLVGFGRNRLVRVPVDGQGRMRADALPRALARHDRVRAGGQPQHRARSTRWRRSPSARARPAPGCTSTARSGCGRPPRRAARTSPRASGLADSWATDGHKWLNVPYDSGLAFVRDAGALRAAMAVTADYLPAERGVRNPSDYTPELSRRARGVDVWAALRSLGRSGLDELVERNCRQAARFAEGLSAAGYEILNDVVLNQVLVSFGEPAETQRVIAGVQADGTCWCGGTVWQGRTAMRISVSSWATTDDDVERSLAAMLRVAQALKRALRARRRRAARRASFPGRPTTCRPSGRPSRSRPAGSDSAGQPSALKGFVSAFMRVVLSGPSIGTGAHGAEAQSRTS